MSASGPDLPAANDSAPAASEFVPTASDFAAAVNDFVAGASEAALAGHVVAALAGSRFGPVALHDEPSPPVQLYTLYLGLRHELRASFKAAVVRAVREWMIEDGVELFGALVRLAGFVEAKDVIPHLRAALETYAADEEGSPFGRLDDPDEPLSTILAVLHGFAPERSVRVLFEDLLSGDALAPRFGAQLFMGLCECDTRSFPDHVPRFLYLVRTYPRFYPRLDMVLDRFLERVTVDVFSREYPRLDPASQQELVSLVCNPAWSLLTLVPVENEMKFVHWESGYSTTVALRPGSVARNIDAVVRGVSDFQEGAVGLVWQALLGLEPAGAGAY